ncbi:MAG TPA: hypothetical protein VK837_12575 [Longimicrobiales bacterium]|nr:hypothetical protein [Longimicrobiales bacterium]
MRVGPILVLAAAGVAGAPGPATGQAATAPRATAVPSVDPVGMRDAAAAAPYRLAFGASGATAPPRWDLRPAAPAQPDPWIAEDKARHFFASLMIGAVAYGGATALSVEWPEAGVAAGAVAGAAGIAKEFSDRSRGRPFSVRDLVWDAAGVGAALLLASRARR